MQCSADNKMRQAWFQTGRQWPTLKEQDPQGPPSTHPSVPHQSASEDDVFSDGCSAGKIESWLLGCGLETGSENSSHNLTVGAAHCCFRHPSILTEESPPVLPARGWLCPFSTWVTVWPPVGSPKAPVTARIPTRFINFPSHAHGINLRLFLQSQLSRLRQEDPGLSLASRFRQVEVLTAMANAFYSLYSHVSRTPLQKLAPPEFSFSPTADGQIGRRFMGSVRSEPRSPVERLKDTVSKMCLYTGSGGSARLGSDSACPRPGFSPGPGSGSAPKKRSSLPDLMGLVLENTKAEPVSRDMEEDNQDTGDSNETSAAVETSAMVKDRETETQGDVDREGEQRLLSDVQDMDNGDSNATSAVGTRMVRDREAETPGHRDTVGDKELDQKSSSDRADLERDRDPVRTPNLGASSLSESGHQREPSSRKKLNFCLTTPSPTCEVGETQNTIHPTGWAMVVAPVAKVTHDVTRPQIVESVHQAPYSSQLQQWNNNTQAAAILSSVISSENVRSDRSFTTSDRLHEPREECLATSNSAKSLEVAVTPISKAESKVESNLGETGTLVVSTFVPIELPSCRKSPCLIIVTDVMPSSSLDTDAPEMVLPPCGGTTALPPAAQCYPGVWRNKTYLSPLKPPPLQGQGQVSHTIQQANSFELEEVHSAGEEDFGQQETIRSISLSRSTVNQNKGLVIRGDSMQSDSSGYADEDIYSPDRDKLTDTAPTGNS
ncbi:unnamed protein product [Coregonus sp. 'balchen']|nr:unnamed protein product [Coregonus sp. 'balchen']